MNPIVALDGRLTRRMSVGMKAYARELCARLPRVAPDLAFRVFDRGGNFGVDEQLVLPAEIRASGARLTHYLSFYAPVMAPVPYVVTVHDLIHLRFPGYFRARVGPYYRTVVRRLCKNAAAVIVDDPRTSGDLGRFLGVGPEKIAVIPLGVNDRFLQPVEPHVAQRPYLIYAGNHRTHKDLPTLITAWRALVAERDLDLYLTGEDDLGETAGSRREARGEIRFVGNLTDDALASYYAGARMLVHPALCEGFGLPMLEAMAAGTAVVACTDAVPQVLAEHALLFGPRDAEGARTAIARLLDDEGLRTRLVNQARAAAAQLTWDRCAAATAEVYRRVLNKT